MKMVFSVGQKVVCIDAKNRPGHVWKRNDAPVQGRIYTVARVLIENGGTSLQLHEQKRHPRSMWKGYHACRFRPVVARKTDISIFKEMLVPKKAREPVL